MGPGGPLNASAASWSSGVVVVRGVSTARLFSCAGLLGAMACAHAPPAPCVGGDAAPNLQSVLGAGGSPPVAPADIHQRLVALYPREAREAGMNGRARFTLRIEVDGTTSGHRLVSTTAAPFAAACLRLLIEAPFTPARNRDGRALPVEVPFTCVFAVEDLQRRGSHLRRGV
ncbi:MAG: energy transducer TonB [Myxococcota bacterium]